MNDRPDPREEKPAPHDQPEVLARIPSGPADNSLHAPSASAGEQSGEAGGPGLPPDALVSMRRSGGIRFTSRQVTVYRDGRVEVGGAPERKLSDAELAELYRHLDAANLPEMPPTTGHQNPDAYAYELVARLEGQSLSVEVFDGSVPAQIAPLIRFLSALTKPSQ